MKSWRSYQSLIELISDVSILGDHHQPGEYQSLIELISDRPTNTGSGTGKHVSISYRVNF